MPIFEYRCQKCDELTEHLQRVSDLSPEKCRRCGGALERLLSAPAVHSSGKEGGQTICDRSSPCCGLDVPCGASPCGDRK